MAEFSDKELKNSLIKKIAKRDIKPGLSVRLETEQRILISAMLDLAIDLVKPKLENCRINALYLETVTRKLEDFVLFKFRGVDASRVVNFCEGADEESEVELSEWIDSKLQILLNHVPHMLVLPKIKESTMQEELEHARNLDDLFDKVEDITEHQIVYNQVVALVSDICLEQVLAEDENDEREKVGKLNLAFIGIYEEEKIETARIVAQIYKELGVLEHNNLLIARRKDLIGDTFEETEKKTKKFIEDAEDCTLYLPEFDDMAELMPINENDKLAVSLILKAMSIQDNMAVIVSAYAENLKPLFKDAEDFYLSFRRVIDFSDNN